MLKTIVMINISAQHKNKNKNPSRSEFCWPFLYFDWPWKKYKEKHFSIKLYLLYTLRLIKTVKGVQELRESPWKHAKITKFQRPWIIFKYLLISITLSFFFSVSSSFLLKLKLFIQELWVNFFFAFCLDKRHFESITIIRINTRLVGDNCWLCFIKDIWTCKWAFKAHSLL